MIVVFTLIVICIAGQLAKIQNRKLAIAAVGKAGGDLRFADEVRYLEEAMRLRLAAHTRSRAALPQHEIPGRMDATLAR
jgi:hypothetical protein